MSPLCWTDLSILANTSKAWLDITLGSGTRDTVRQLIAYVPRQSTAATEIKSKSETSVFAEAAWTSVIDVSA